MPIPLAAIAAGAQIGQSITNPLFSHLTNVKNRKFAREQYKTERRDALSDWAMNNEYNSPRAQMQRFQEAGLNPNLIYGQMQEASPVRSSNAPGAQASAPQTDIGSAFMNMYEMKQRSAQTDLLAKQLEVQSEEIALKKAQTTATLVNTGKVSQDVARGAVQQQLEAALVPYQLEHAELTNRKTATDISLSFNEDERRTALNASTISEAAERILRSRAERSKIPLEKSKILQEIENMKKDGTLKDYDIEMRKKGINPGDPGYWRILKEITSSVQDNLQKAMPEKQSDGTYRHPSGQYTPHRPWGGQANPLPRNRKY